MFLTNILSKSAKGKIVMVMLESTGSFHKIVSFREKTAPKKEIIFFDPHVGMECVYKEIKKIRTISGSRPLKLTQQYNEHTYGIISEEMEKEFGKLSHKN